MQGDVLSAGVELMLVGMSTVFVFLTLLVIATTVMSAAIQRFLPADAASPEELAAITAAVHRHRQRK
ncbi:MAG: OadG family transporter subunit [Gammaproteobacteria bacterium]|nr:OadG family transporter subunit [Gammaproteobacteria bacterium]